jgi:hypothetical protein
MGFIPDIVIDSSVAFIRVFSPALSIKPEMTFSYTILREANRPTFITATFGRSQVIHTKPNLFSYFFLDIIQLFRDFIVIFVFI